MISVKGYEFNIPKIRDSHTRRALRFKNSIIENLRVLGVPEDDVEIEVEPVAIKRVPAKASWWINDSHLHYTYKGGSYVENLFVVYKLITLEIQAVVEGIKTLQEFIDDFEEEPDVEEERQAAREHLGVEEHASLDEINKAYKKLAKAAHPDMGTGDEHTFKELNKAHKILKRELE